MIVQQLSSSTDNSDKKLLIDAFLASFTTRCESFRAVYQAYLEEKVELGEITRALSEATADAEMDFSQYSTDMSMEQLQRFATLQGAFDDMMVQIFSEEIRRNRQTCAQAIENGEYFLIGLTHKGIQSAIYMMHSKDRIKTEKERKLTELEQEQANIQSMLKVLKAVQQAFAAEMDLQAMAKIEKALKLYVSFFNNTPRTDLLSACDRRMLQQLKQHFTTLLELSSGPLTYEHLSRCCQALAGLPMPEALEPLFGECHQLAKKQPPNRTTTAA